MKTSKPQPTLRQDLKWLQRTNIRYYKQDFLFAIGLASGFVAIATFILS